MKRLALMCMALASTSRYALSHQLLDLTGDSYDLRRVEAGSGAGGAPASRARRALASQLYWL
jgi:hypothetical protein